MLQSQHSFAYVKVMNNSRDLCCSDYIL